MLVGMAHAQLHLGYSAPSITRNSQYRCNVSDYRFGTAPSSFPFSSSSPYYSLNLIRAKLSEPNNFVVKSELPSSGGGVGNNGIGYGAGGGGNGGWSEGDGNDFGDSLSSGPGIGILGLFLNGWRSRVAADPQFPFKVLMEELVGVSSSVLGDMASRPNFGLNELDFVFSTLVVGSILNFTLMYLLAPTLSSSSLNLPSIFANCPTSHMFEPGAYTILNRFGTFVYKGAVFAAVGLAAGLVGTAISNGLISMRKKMDPNFATPNKPPPMLLNALTWAIHMGINSNFRYQTLNGMEFLLAKGLPPLAFKSSVVVLRCLNNVLGGMTFVILARLTGSQSVEEAKPIGGEVGSVPEKEKFIDGSENFQSNPSTCK
ncbi:LOW QUALITY PROTEIN: protein RETICULATA-RELATED 3, chloroplastic-like [Juglans microcarpa x Juglans regia]|uniref:LOW QUALITY PROTEIN: protein RETICULATA-RELATED 3, chloroplastic-like n=1 Tax=Juglans microcarpa x Juglans regia TaxID=2249226 RepID=UPI001B7EEF16|nr:LOW QUALITY PROTEIN: protein RETICULATA-RELATED 3, chloroplastic-like [Juglans microcarpa x Juglans regia]